MKRKRKTFGDRHPDENNNLLIYLPQKGPITDKQQRSCLSSRKYYQQQIVKNLKYNMRKLTLLVALLTVISAATFADGRKVGESSEFQMVAKSEV